MVFKVVNERHSVTSRTHRPPVEAHAARSFPDEGEGSMFLKTIAFALTAVFVVACVAETQSPAGPRWRVVAVNYGLVFTKYDKARDIKIELENELQPFKMKADPIKEMMNKLKESIDGPKV